MGSPDAALPCRARPLHLPVAQLAALFPGGGGRLLGLPERARALHDPDVDGVGQLGGPALVDVEPDDVVLPDPVLAVAAKDRDLQAVEAVQVVDNLASRRGGLAPLVVFLTLARGLNLNLQRTTIFVLIL